MSEEIGSRLVRSFVPSFEETRYDTNTNLETSSATSKRDKGASPEEEDVLHLRSAKVGGHLVDLGDLGRGEAQAETVEGERDGARDLGERVKPVGAADGWSATFGFACFQRHQVAHRYTLSSLGFCLRPRPQHPPTLSLSLCTHTHTYTHAHTHLPLLTRQESRPIGTDKEDLDSAAAALGAASFFSFLAGLFFFLGAGLLLFFLAAGDLERAVRLRVERRVATIVFFRLTRERERLESRISWF